MRKYTQRFSPGGCYVEGGLNKSRFSITISIYFENDKTEDEQELVYDLSNSAISNDLEWPLTQNDVKDIPLFDV